MENRAMSGKTYEIEHYLTEINVKPYPSHRPLKLDGNEPIFFKAGETRKYEGEPRSVYTGTVGKLCRTVEFAKDNTYIKPFEIRYGTLASGAIKVDHDVDNEVHGKQLTPFLRNAQSYGLKFVPPTEEPWPYLDLEVFKGFDRGNRNAHFHLDDPNQEEFDVRRHYRQMTYVLNLSDFQNRERPFRQPARAQPRLWHTPNDTGHVCSQRAASILHNPERHEKNLIPPDPEASRPGEWLWTWKLEEITGGIIDIIWEDFLIPPHDVFISHASEDKKDFVIDLVQKLEALGLDVWFDDNELTIGDELTQNIVRGIAFSLTGVVVLSPRFFDRKKTWTKKELEMISSSEGDTKVILPVLYEMSVDDLRKENPDLAELVGAKAEDGVDKVAAAIVKAVTAIQTLKNIKKN